MKREKEFKTGGKKDRYRKGRISFLKRVSFVSLVLFLIILLLVGTSDFIFGKTKIFSQFGENVREAIFARQEGISGERMLLGPGDESWKVLPIRSQQEYELWAVGGESEQHPQGIARSLYNPDVIYLSHDIGQVWKSINGGNTWKHTLGKGIYVQAGQGIEVDPVNVNRAFVMMDESWNFYMPEKQGVYLTEDGGDNWKLVLPVQLDVKRRYQHQIDFCLSSVDASGAKKRYAATDQSGLHRSDDYGQTWSNLSSISGEIYDIECDPSNKETIYIATASGLQCSYNGGQSLSACGNLPAGTISSIEISNSNSNLIYATIYNIGVYKTNSGVNGFSQLGSAGTNIYFIFMNPGFNNKLYVVTTSSRSRYSSDSGLTWTTMEANKPFPGLGRTGGWKYDFYGGLSGIVPNPLNENEAVAFSKGSLWKTTNGGRYFNETSTLFTGYAWGKWGGSAISFDKFDENRWFAFYADTGMTITENKGEYFERSPGMDGSYQLFGMFSGAIQPVANYQIIVASSEGGNRYSEGMNYFKSKIVRSTDLGQNWDIIYTDTVTTSGILDTGMQNMFIGFNPNNPNIVYAGDKVSYDAGANWQEIVGLDAYDGSYNAEVVGICESNPNIIYAISGNPRNKIIRSIDGGTNWILYSQPGNNFNGHDSTPTNIVIHPQNCDVFYGLNSGSDDLRRCEGNTCQDLGLINFVESHFSDSDPDNFVWGIAIDPNHPEIIYASMFQYGISSLFRSIDSGQTWQDISYNLPRLGYSALKVNPHTGELFLGSAIGTWILPPPKGFSYPSLELVYDKYYARSVMEEGNLTEEESCSPGYASNISQYNITWTFDKCYRVGNFVNGDYWVVGPVNIVNITPASTDIAGRVMHGSMINPSPANGSSQGYDSIMHQYGSINVNSYVASLNAARPNGMDLSASNPLQVKGNSSLISTISFGVSTRPQTKSAAVLTVLDASPSVDSFRPAYSGNDKEIIYQVSNLNFSKLLKLPLTSGAPTPSSIEYKVAKPWIDHIPSFLARYQHPADNMQDYSRDFSEDESIIALVLNLNYSDEEKKTLLISFVQLGIDNYRNILLGKDLAEGNWVPLEGQNMGRKLPIVFAGLVLSDDKMLSIGVWNSSIPVGNLNPVFQEDLNIFKVFESDVGRAVQGVNAGDGVAETYNPSHVGLPEWGSRHYGPYDDITRDNANWGAEYRHINTMGMLGTALAVNIMGLRDHWKNDLFFDYYDRVVVTEKQMGYWIGYRDQSWGGAINEFIFNMWNTYRDDFGCSWMDINPTIVDGTRKSRYDCNGDYVYDVDCYFVNSCSDYATQRARDYDPCNIGSCGSVVSTCGDLSCNGFENCSTCSVDCGACADTTPPTRSNGRPTGILPIGTTSVNINLTTDETAICRYSTSAGQSYGSMANTFLRNGNLHYYALNGLIAGAYNYYARCNDSYGNFNTNDYLISFSIAADTTAPVISSVVNSSITNRSAIISWQTNENANSRIYYGLSSVNLNLNAIDGNYLLSHSLSLGGLLADTIYYYKTGSCDSTGNCANSSIYNFRTLVTSIPGSFEINMGRIIGAGAAEGTVELLEGTIKNVVFNLSVDGNVADINDATASARFSKSGVDRTNSSCRFAYSEANKRVYKCTIGMQFYDEAGDWNILANISDTFGNMKVNNTKRISVGTLMGISLISLSAGFSNANPGNSDILAQGMPLIVTNKGNYESLIAILGHNLHGAVRSGEYINVNNFMAGTGAGVCSTGTALANGTAVAVSGSLLTRGISSTKDIYYCMKNVPSVSSQKYSTLLLFGWKISLS